MAKKKQRKRKIFRLIPITVTMLSLLFIIKVNDLYLNSRQLRELYGVRDAVAEEKAEPKKEEHADDKKDAKADDAKKDEHGEAKKDEATDANKDEGHGDKKEDAKTDEKSAEHGDKKEEVKGDAKEESGHGEKKEEGGHGEKKEEGGHGEAKPEEEPKTYGTGKSTIKEIEAMKAKDAQPRFTQTELDILQNLSKRRDELDTREKDLEIKSKVLDASEKRINDKVAEMKTLQASLEKVIATYNEKQDTQIKSLVKIYENMKPGDAANIFNEMQMPILLEVIDKMSERKVAPVLAAMDPKKARDVTQELAEKREKSPVGGASAPAATK